MSATIDTPESALNDFDAARRKEALRDLMAQVDAGAISLPEPGRAVNLHCHTFFSFNGYGYSPTCLAWKARKAGLAAAGIVDFDVLDAVDEFLEACRIVGLRGCAGIETRTFIPSFATRVINSPGEPGISYHMGVGFTTAHVARPGILPELKATAQARNRGILDRVNPHLAPVILDYDRDVLPLAPNGNPTERHLCMAFDAKAREQFPNDEARAEFWAGKLGGDPAALKAMLSDPPTFQGHIRSKTMKAGGVGYVKPEGPDFPDFSRINAFIREAGAIPVFAWLDGTTDGEQAIDELIGVMREEGAAAINVIPDRSWNLKNPAERQRKTALLHDIVARAQALGMPLMAGTEMNAYGQRFVDDFDAPEMAPLIQPALEGARILYAHTLLQARKGVGYLSAWAAATFADVHAKNRFFEALGRAVDPRRPEALDPVDANMDPNEILKVLSVKA